MPPAAASRAKATARKTATTATAASKSKTNKKNATTNARQQAEPAQNRRRTRSQAVNYNESDNEASIYEEEEDGGDGDDIDDGYGESPILPTKRSAPPAAVAGKKAKTTRPLKKPAVEVYGDGDDDDGTSGIVDELTPVRPGYRPKVRPIEHNINMSESSDSELDLDDIEPAPAPAPAKTKNKSTTAVASTVAVARGKSTRTAANGVADTKQPTRKSSRLSARPTASIGLVEHEMLNPYSRVSQQQQQQHHQQLSDDSLSPPQQQQTKPSKVVKTKANVATAVKSVTNGVPKSTMDFEYNSSSKAEIEELQAKLDRITTQYDHLRQIKISEPERQLEEYQRLYRNQLENHKQQTNYLNKEKDKLASELKNTRSELEDVKAQLLQKQQQLTPAFQSSTGKMPEDGTRDANMQRAKVMLAEKDKQIIEWRTKYEDLVERTRYRTFTDQQQQQHQQQQRFSHSSNGNSDSNGNGTREMIDMFEHLTNMKFIEVETSDDITTYKCSVVGVNGELEFTLLVENDTSTTVEYACDKWIASKTTAKKQFPEWMVSLDKTTSFSSEMLPLFFWRILDYIHQPPQSSQ
ncbi:hypothetical protein GQ42DRAFT_178623 [Ramicandelaber brevisporus]|nr:hypothetical protein GQ42DRAFT_178623 [Ramicandelaber brevisporus]